MKVNGDNDKDVAISSFSQETMHAFRQLKGQTSFSEWFTFLEEPYFLPESEFPDNDNALVVISKDSIGGFGCIEIGEPERFLAFDSRYPESLRVINSSLAQYLACLDADDDYFAKRQERFGGQWPGYGEGLDLVEELKKKLFEIDPVALDGCLWSVRVEQYEEGLI